MSLKARRITGPVETAAFPWQSAEPEVRPGGATVVPLFRKLDRPVEVQPVALPSLTAERLAAAESTAYAHGHAEGYQSGQKAAMAGRSRSCSCGSIFRRD